MRSTILSLGAAALMLGASAQATTFTFSGDPFAGSTAPTTPGLINDIPTCDQLVSRIVADAEELITERLADMVDVSARENVA